MKQKDEKIIFILFAILVTGVIIAFSTMFDQAFIMPKRAILRILTAVIAVFYVYRAVQFGQLKRDKLPVYAALLYLSVYILSLVFSIHLLSGVEYFQDLLCYIIIFIIAYQTFAVEEGDKFKDIILFTGIAVSVYSLVQHSGRDPVGWDKNYLVIDRSISTFGNPDFLSAFLVMVIPLAIAGLFAAESKKKSGVYLGILWLLSFTNLFTYSRAGLVSMLGVVLITFVFIGKNLISKNIWKTVAVILIILFAFGALKIVESTGRTGHTFDQRIQAFANTQEVNVSSRIYLWKVGALVISKHPLLGTGPGTFSISYLPYRYLEPTMLRHRIAFPDFAHNIIIDIGIASGVAGIIAFLIFSVLIAYWGVVYFYGKKKDSDKAGEKVDNSKRVIAAGFAGGLFAYYLHHMAGFPTIPADVLFWAFAAFSLIYFKGYSKEAEEPKRKKDKKIKIPAYKYAYVVLIGIIAIAAIYFTVREASADLAFKRAQDVRGAISEQQVDPKLISSAVERAAFDYDKAVSGNSFNQDYWLGRGKFYEALTRMSADKQQILDFANKAIDSYKMAIALNPRNPYPFADMGRLYGVFEYYDNSEIYYKKSFELDPYNPVVSTDYAFTLKNAGKLDNAGTIFTHVTQIYPDVSWPFVNAGVFFLERERYPDAEKYLKRALDINISNNQRNPDMEKEKEKIEEYLRQIEKVKDAAGSKK